MTTIYKCDMCGATFDSHDEASKCEESHKLFCDDLDEVLKPRCTYSKKGVMPDTAILAVDLGSYDYETSQRTHEFVLGEYKLVRKLTPEQTAAIVKEYDDKQEASRLWWENYKKEQEAKKAAEAAKQEQ